MPLWRQRLPPHYAGPQTLSGLRRFNPGRPMPQNQHLNWGAQALWQSLEPLLPGLFVEVLAHADSTNTRLLERARESSGQRSGPITRPGELDTLHPRLAGERTPHGRRTVDVQPCLLVAEQQSRGRGRLGRDWVSNVGASLTFSLSLPLAPAQWGGLSLAAGLAIAQALEPLPPDALPRVVLKWPNDLWLRDPAGGSGASDQSTGHGLGRKLGGILIETVSVGERRMCVVGVGLNVLPQDISGLAHGYACVHEIDPDASAPNVLARIAEPLVQALLKFQTEGFAPLHAAYEQRDLLKGQTITTSLPACPLGVAEGVDELGALRVRGDGLHHVLSGEVSVRLHGAPPSPPV
jgi:BirA family transcriptional regulator, biotin operon repressor / biotin---[acetyl-CoA-carboxylase] ligase